MNIQSVKKRLADGCVFLTLLILAVSFLYPIYYMCINSVKTKAAYRVNPFALPKTLSFTNFYLLIRNFKILESFLNTLIIAIGSVAITIVISVFASYAFAKIKFKGSNAVYLIIICTMFIPGQVIMVPLYFLMSYLGLTNQLISVIMATVVTSLPGTILLMTTNFKGISNEMIEAATIDGAGYFQIVYNVIVPMGMAVIAISVIFGFLYASNDLFTPMILLTKVEKRTLMVALSAIMSARGGDPAYQQAGLLIGALPQILIYILFSRFIIKGITIGSIK